MINKFTKDNNKRNEHYLKCSCLLIITRMNAIVNCNTNERQTKTRMTMFNAFQRFLITINCFNCAKLLAVKKMNRIYRLDEDKISHPFKTLIYFNLQTKAKLKKPLAIFFCQAYDLKMLFKKKEFIATKIKT